MQAKKHIQKLLQCAGIQINGERSFDVHVHDERLYKLALNQSTLGLGEAYMNGWWDCEALDEFIFRLLRNIEIKDIYNLTGFLRFFVSNLFINQQSKLRSKHVAEKHYDLSNELYYRMLGKSMAYTCGYWRHTNHLDQAQYAKYDLVCRKLGLTKGEKVLELGCGWGGFAKYAAEHYGCEMVSINISKQQMNYAKELCKELPVQLYVCDYRDVNAYNPKGIQFDKVVSIGMCEHVGYKNYAKFMQIVRRNIKKDGLFLMHTIGKNRSVLFADPWIRKYIFPGGMLPSVKWLSRAIENQFVIEDIHNFGSDYDKTLLAWHENFIKSWPEISGHYDERFYRMWRYYLLSCAGAFRSRDLQLWQFVLSPRGVLGGYVSIR